MSTLEQGDREAASVQKDGAPRVTLEYLHSLIVSEEFSNPSFAQHVTRCTIQVRNGYVVHGQSAPADPANFDKAFGQKLARDDAIRQLWPLEGYLLRQKLYNLSQSDAVTGD
jgi:hypothetical protein